MVEICPNITDQRSEKVENGKTIRGFLVPTQAVRLKAKNFGIFKGCVDKLPDKQGRVFFWPEIDEESSEQICDALSISPSNFLGVVASCPVKIGQVLEGKLGCESWVR